MKRDIKQLINEMTLEEKASLCSGEDFWHLKGIDRLGIPSVMVSDGPHGLRKQNEAADHLGINDSISAVCFPSACATASSFDIDLMEDMGKTLGIECQAENVSTLLGPAVNIKRSPLCGRNFEYISEDPYLTGKMATAYIRGVQSQNVGTSVKHFAANNQEYMRTSSSSNLSERAFREIYLSAFETIVKEARPWTVMCSYNKINGVFASENHRLLTEILREEWGFEGYVMTDWGAVADRVKGMEAGLDLEMPGSGGMNDAKIVAAVKEGRLSEKLVDQAVERILNILFAYVDHRQLDAVFDREEDHRKAVSIETESAVLLENNGILPLKADAEVVYIGGFAKNPRYQGGGSSHINSSKVTSALETAKEKSRNVSYLEGFPIDGDTEDEIEIMEAVEAAKGAKTVVIFAGLPDCIESEGYDRKDMKLPTIQNHLIEAVAAVQPNTVVVLHNGSPIEAPWADKVAAVLEMYLGGQGVGEATDQILFGEVNPSGHLAETFPLKLEDNPSYLNFPGNKGKVDYAEGIYVGYRYYDTKKMPVRWAFGHGLSYTTFSFSNLRISPETLNDNSSIRVSVDIKNTGKRYGKEVVQLYVSDQTGTGGRPEKELKGFAKVALQPEEIKTVSFELRIRDFSFYHEELEDWYAPSGIYEVQIGNASDKIALRGNLSLLTEKMLPMYVDGATTLGELQSHLVTAPIIEPVIQGVREQMVGAKSEKEDPLGTGNAMLEALMNDLPLKSLASFGGAAMAEQVDALIKTLNHALGNS